MTQPLKVALIGYGFAGQTFHAPIIAAVPGLELRVVGSSQPERVRADWPEAQVLLPQAALAHPEVDLVVIATPNTTHFALAQSALLADKHLVVDKPFTLTVQEAVALKTLAQQNGKLLSVYHNRRWDADFRTLQGLLGAETLGQVVHFESHFDRYRPQVRSRWREQDLPGSGLWFDLGPHLVDQALRLFGLPEALYADFALQREGAQAVDYFHVLLRYPKLRVILHASQLVAGGNPRFVVHGTKGSFVKYGLDTQEEVLKTGGRPGGASWGHDPSEGDLYLPGEPARKVQNQPGDYSLYYQAIRDALTQGGANPVPPQQAIQVMQLIELANQSAQQQRELPFEV